MPETIEIGGIRWGYELKAERQLQLGCRVAADTYHSILATREALEEGLVALPLVARACTRRETCGKLGEGRIGVSKVPAMQGCVVL